MKPTIVSALTPVVTRAMLNMKSDHVLRIHFMTCRPGVRRRFARERGRRTHHGGGARDILCKVRRDRERLHQPRRPHSAGAWLRVRQIFPGGKRWLQHAQTFRLVRIMARRQNSNSHQVYVTRL